MKPLIFHPATITPESIEEAIPSIMEIAGITEAAARAVAYAQAECETYLSECGTWQVQVRRDVENGFDQPMAHLSIKRVDREAVHDWRALQEIKNALIGPENEALELYPAESRRVDSVNQYHLFVFLDPEVRVPFGWTERLVTDAQVGPSKQRRFDPATHRVHNHDVMTDADLRAFLEIEAGDEGESYVMGCILACDGQWERLPDGRWQFIEHNDEAAA